MGCSDTALVGLLGLVVLLGAVQRSSASDAGQRSLAQDHHPGHGDGISVQPVPFAYCKPFLERLSHNDQRQLRESYQHYHAAFARFVRAQRNHDAFKQGPPKWIQGDDARQGWNLTYIVGQDMDDLAATLSNATTLMNSMQQRIQAQLDQLVAHGSLPPQTDIDDLSPCIMRKIYPSQFPDQPDVSLLLRLRGPPTNPSDWPQPEVATKEPPTGRGPEAVAAFLQRLMACSSVAPLELVVALTGPAAAAQATTWAWQSWTSEGFVVPLVDSTDREAHVLNRLAAVARGSVLVALSTDRPEVGDHLLGAAAGAGGSGGPEGDCTWLQRILTLYHRIPQLGAMTHGRFSFSHPAPLEPGAQGGALRLLGPSPGGGTGVGTGHNNQFFKERMTSVPFQYVLYGDYMPMSFRRSALEEVGGFDEDLPQGDEPCSSLLRRDLSLRLWKSGWRVGAHDTGLLQVPVGAPQPAASSDPTRCSPEVAALAADLFNARHAPPDLPAAASAGGGDPPSSSSPMDVLMARVRELNMGSLDPMSPEALNPCPMAQGC